jgi:DNA-binding beta-propeller fold protein YncE
VEPEGVAVDTVENVVYVGTKAPEPEPFNGACPSGTFFIDEDGDEECWTAGTIYAFNAADITKGPIKTIPAGDDPESVVFANDMVYAANEDDGTVTIARAVNADGCGGELVTDTPVYSPTAPPYSLGVFYSLGPNTLACPDKRYEADKMTVGGHSVFITDDKSRVAKITDAVVVNLTTVPIDPILGQCDLAKGNDENGLNTANNVAFMRTSSGSALYVVSEQNTVAILDPKTLALRATITIPGAVHLDAIGVDSSAGRIWITDEVLMGVFVLQGACADGTGVCAK